MSTWTKTTPKHMAHMMRKMKDIMPPGTVRRNSMWPSNGSKPAKTGKDRADMGDLLGDFMGGPGGEGAPAATTQR